MELIVCLSVMLCCILLFAYLRLKKEIRSLHKQVQYQIETTGSFRNFSMICDRDLQHLREDIQHLHELHAQEQLKSMHADQQLKEMITNIAHDIRTPLTSMRGYIELIKECDNASDQERYLEIMQGRFAYLKELLEELFLYTKLTHPGYEIHKERLVVCELLSKVLMSMYEDFQKRGMLMDIQYETETEAIESDTFLLERVFMNILSNMLKYGTGKCRIHQDHQGEQYRIAFINEVDQPLSEEQLTQLFERFHSLDPTRSAQTSGLGLAIVKTIMEKLEGKVNARCDDHELIITIVL